MKSDKISIMTNDHTIDKLLRQIPKMQAEGMFFSYEASNATFDRKKAPLVDRFSSSSIIMASESLSVGTIQPADK